LEATAQISDARVRPLLHAPRAARSPRAAEERDERIEHGIVVLGDWHERVLTVMSEKPVVDVIASLANLTPRNGPFGPYHWMNADLSPHSPDLPADDPF
jgi:hypothetical protein